MLITTPISSRVLAMIATLLSSLMLVVVAEGSITRTVTVSGTLVPHAGVIRLFSPQQGIVTEKRFAFGDRVKQGQPLYFLSSDRTDSAGAQIAAEIGNSIRNRRAVLQETLETTRALQAEERERINRRHDDLVRQATALSNQIRVQGEMLTLDRSIVARKVELRASGAVPIEQLETSQRQSASDDAQMISLTVSLVQLQQSLAETEAQLRELPLNQSNQISDLDRQIDQAEVDLADNERRREIVIVSPADGTVSADLAEVGQTVTSGAPMGVIAPQDAKLEAHLLVPSRGIGFVRPGALVALRYQAYPYQKFGTYEGRVTAVSEVALSPPEMEILHVPGTADEPAYRVTVGLTRQTVDALGEEQPLRGGMLVDAEVKAETRRIWEWMFEPVYSMRGSAAFGTPQ